MGGMSRDSHFQQYIAPTVNRQDIVLDNAIATISGVTDSTRTHLSDAGSECQWHQAAAVRTGDWSTGTGGDWRVRKTEHVRLAKLTQSWSSYGRYSSSGAAPRTPQARPHSGRLRSDKHRSLTKPGQRPTWVVFDPCNIWPRELARLAALSGQGIRSGGLTPILSARGSQGCWLQRRAECRTSTRQARRTVPPPLSPATTLHRADQYCSPH